MRNDIRNAFILPLAVALSATAFGQVENRPDRDRVEQRKAEQQKDEGNRLPSACLASELKGTELRDASGEDKGEIKTVFIDMDGQRVAFALVHHDDLKDRDYAVPLERIQFRMQDGDFVAQVDKDELMKCPNVDEGDMSAAGRLKVDRHGMSDKSRAGGTDEPRTGDRERARDLDDERMNGEDREHDANVRGEYKPLRDIRGQDVVDSTGETLGELDDLVVNLETGEILYARITSGGILGIGEDRHAVPLSALRLPTDSDLRAEGSDVSRDDLVFAAPGTTLDRAPEAPEDPSRADSAFVDKVHRQFGDKRSMAMGTTGRDLDRGAGTTAMEAGNILKTKDIKGMDVHNRSNEKIGSVEDVLVSDGRIAVAIVSVGGFLGMGDKKVAVPWQAFQMRSGDKALTLNAERSTLEQAQEIDEDSYDQIKDAQYFRGLNQQFGVQNSDPMKLDTLVQADKLIESDVRGRTGEDIGSVQDLAIDPQSGKIRYAALQLDDSDGSLFAVNWDELQIQPRTNTVMLNIDPAQLRSRGFDENRWPRDAQGATGTERRTDSTDQERKDREDRDRSKDRDARDG